MPLLTFTPFKFELANDLKGKNGAEGFSLGPISGHGISFGLSPLLILFLAQRGFLCIPPSTKANS